MMTTTVKSTMYPVEILCDPEVTSTAFRLYLVLASTTPNPSVDEISDLTTWSASKVRREIATLLDSGWIHRRKRLGESTESFLCVWKHQEPPWEIPLSIHEIEHDLPTDGFTVYRLWDKEGRLLYVGSSERPRRRLDQHLRTQPWRDAIERATYEQAADHLSMLSREMDAIRSESPLHNKTGMP